jgi:hypothetical protein
MEISFEGVGCNFSREMPWKNHDSYEEKFKVI